MELILEDPIKYLGFTPIKIGRWWNNQKEIDLVALGNKNAAFIECKWQKQKAGHKVLCLPYFSKDLPLYCPPGNVLGLIRVPDAVIDVCPLLGRTGHREMTAKISSLRPTPLR